MEIMKDELLAALAPHGQEHLLAFWDELSGDRQQSLAQQIRAVDLNLLNRLFQHKHEHGDFREMALRAGPPPAFRLDKKTNRFTAAEAVLRGKEALDAGQLGVILVAGGQGTRLGFEHPKGMFPIGPVSDRSLFQIHVEKIIATGRRHGVRIPLYLMTSPATHEETIEYFTENDHFGLAEEDLMIFCQGTMPAVDSQSGKMLLADKDRLAVSPDGHGGMLAALVAGGCLEDIAGRGIRNLFYLQIDNPLVDICSAEFVGYHLLSGSELSTQVIAKREPLEKVGNVVEVDGRVRVIEYSDLPDEAANRREDNGSLSIWAGSIGVHVMDTLMLARLLDNDEALPFHVANKKVPHMDASGDLVSPQEPNAIKFERFIFDLIPSAENAMVVEVDPADAFAPLKNASGAADDTPESVRALMIDQHTRWLRGADVEVDQRVEVEISPLFATDAEELAGKIEPETRVSEATYFC
jgi:UDP-N-acetylglucosamine/UDP-N-acetylgalactosamine diphosphorylase